MDLLVPLTFAIIGLFSLAGSAYLWRLYREDRAADDPPRVVRLSFVIAVLGTGATLASNYLGTLSVVRILGIPEFPRIAAALTPLTIVALVVLDLSWPLLALYLRSIRRRRSSK